MRAMQKPNACIPESVEKSGHRNRSDRDSGNDRKVLTWEVMDPVLVIECHSGDAIDCLADGSIRLNALKRPLTIPEPDRTDDDDEASMTS